METNTMLELELISVNLKEAVGRGDFVKVGHQIRRLDKWLKQSQTEMPSVVKTKQILVGFKDWYNRQRKSPILFVEIDEYLSQPKIDEDEKLKLAFEAGYIKGEGEPGLTFNGVFKLFDDWLSQLRGE